MEQLHYDVRRRTGVERMETVEAITLDVGGTLIEPWPSVGHIYAEVAARNGVQAEPEELTHALSRRGRHRVPFNTLGPIGAVVDATFEGLGTQLPSQTFFGELNSHIAKAECWHVYEDAIPTLTASGSGVLPWGDFQLGRSPAPAVEIARAGALV